MPDTVPIVVEIAELRKAIAAARGRGLTIGFVPTMGALHEGHAALIRRSSRETGFTVVSIFVNPTQFGPTEDLAKYPRTLDADRVICQRSGADLIFAPTVATMYPAGAVTTVEVGELDRHLCGPRRPGHFRGVCTVVAKLFNLVQPDVAILKRMTADLDFPIRIVAGDTVREADGLAMSSRNRYLTATERTNAATIYRSLKALHERAVTIRDVKSLERLLKMDLATIPDARIDYAQIVDDETLQPIDRLDRPALAAIAVFVGTTRLIDNIELPAPRS
jgi:pantoate--beta-alanine ligase